MPEWVNIVLPIGTLALGSLLTMVGQALNDRRADERARRARREEFLSSSFDVHRSAMLDMQELVGELFAAYQSEKQRRSNDGFYQYMKGFPIRNSVLKVFGRTSSLLEGMDAIKDASSDKERDALVKASAAQVKVARKELAGLTDDFHAMNAVLETLYPFWGEFKQFIPKLRLCMLRSGSNSVLYSGEEFINAIFKWSDYFQLNDHEKILSEQVRVAHSEVNRALSNALKFGPYDTYEAYKDSSPDGERPNRAETE
jgi:hypothetical protein